MGAIVIAVVGERLHELRTENAAKQRYFLRQTRQGLGEKEPHWISSDVESTQRVDSPHCSEKVRHSKVPSLGETKATNGKT
jgi:hypothetical protein